MSNNVVIVDVNAEVAMGGAEVQAALDGPNLLPAIEAGLAEFCPPFAGTFVKPTPYVGNPPWHIWSAGPQTWRLGFSIGKAAVRPRRSIAIRGPRFTKSPSASS